jgi:membrane-bound serine protease (ClpP class)
VLVLIAIALAIFLLPQPWGLIAIVVAAVADVTEVIVFRWWSQRKRARVGVQVLVGKTAIALSALAPHGQVRIAGEIWEAHSASPIARGEEVVVRGIDGLTLLVEQV